MEKNPSEVVNAVYEVLDHFEDFEGKDNNLIMVDDLIQTLYQFIY